MATQVQYRRGTTAQHSTFTGAAAELTVDTDKKTVVVHDGTTAGGVPLAKESALSSYLTTSTASSTYAPLASPTFTGTVTIPAGASISGYAPTATPTFTGQPYVNGSYRANVTAIAALDLDCSLGNLFTKTINGASTFTVSNVPASRSYTFTLVLTHTSGAITWFSGVIWPGGTAPTLTTGKVHLFIFQTDNGGTTWRASSLINYAS